MKKGIQKPVKGNTGIMSGGASQPSTKSFKGMGTVSAYANPAKSNPGGRKK